MSKKILLRIVVIIVVVGGLFFYADTCYLARAVKGRCQVQDKECDQITFMEVLLNHGKYQKLLKEKYNIIDYLP